MHVWFRWIALINPAFYALEAVMGSEFGNLQLACEEPQYIPYGTSYTNNAYRSSVIGTSQGSQVIDGQNYIETQYTYSRHHVWRNVGIIIGFWIFFAFMTALGYELTKFDDEGSKLVYKRGTKDHKELDRMDPEKAVSTTQAQSSSASDDEKDLGHQSTFTFKDISYFVHYEGAEKQLLNKISGFVKPGQLVALMGSSDAGKTT